MVDITGNVNPTFHVVFRDDDGTPLIGGSVYWYKASDHSTLKNVYEDRALTIPLPNPTPLNDAGIVSDATGAPKPVFLEDDENYYVVVYRGGESPPTDIPIQTVDDWNADNAFSTQPQFDEIVTTNFMPNAQFRSLINGKASYSSSELNATNNVLIARNDWYLRRDVLTSTNTLDFKSFIVGQTDVPFNPKYYLNFSCSVISTETAKDIAVDIGDAESFSNQELTFSIWAKSSTLSQIEVLSDQDFGSGGSSQELTVLKSFQLTNSWARYSTTFTVANVSGKTIGDNNKFRIRVRVPLNAICNIDFVMCQLNLGNTILEFDYEPSIDNDGNASKDAIPQPTDTDAFKVLSIDSDKSTNIWRSFPPVASVHWMATKNVPVAYLECNGSTREGYEGSIYRNLANALGREWGVGSKGFEAYNNSKKYLSIALDEFDTNVTDIADGTTGFTFETTEQGGDKRFISSITGISTVRVTNKDNGIVPNATPGTSGFTINIIQFGSIIQPEITDITTTGSTGLAGKYFEISSKTTDYYVWFTIDGAGADPTVAGRTGIKIGLPDGLGSAVVKAFVYYALYGCELSLITTNAASTLTAGDYFTINNSITTYVPWYRIDGAGSIPGASGTKVAIDINSSDTDIQVATKTELELSKILFKVPKLSGYFIRGWDHGEGIDPGASTRLGQRIGVFGDNIGTNQTLEMAAGSAVKIPNVYLMPVIKY